MSFSNFKKVLSKPENMIRLGKTLIVVALAFFVYSGVLYAIIDHSGNKTNMYKISDNTAILNKEKVYTITFKDKDEKTYVKVKDGEKIEEKKKTDSDFIGWYKDGELYDFSLEVKSSFILVARYKSDNLFTVSFDTDGGNIMGSSKVVQGEKLKKPSNPTRTGYKFVRWELDGKAYDFSKPVTEDITLVAIWEEKEKVNITFDSDGGTNVDKIISYVGDKIGKLPTPEKDGYTFDGWYEGDIKYTENAVLSQDISLKAKWILKEEVTVKFDSDGGTEVSDIKLYKGEKIDKLPTTTKENNDFLGWFDGNTKYTEKTEIEKDVTLKAKWKVIDSSEEGNEPGDEPGNVTKYTVTFDSDGGNNINSIKVNENEKIGDLPVPEKEGFNFDGWYLDDKLVNKNYVVVEDITLKAKWTVDTVIVPEDSDMENAKNLIKDSYDITSSGEITITSDVCTIELTNKDVLQNITREETDKNVTLTFRITCGDEVDTKDSTGIIKASTYTFTVENGEEESTKIITISDSPSGSLYVETGLLVGTVTDGTITINGDVSDRYILKVGNTSYVVVNK